MSRGFLSTMPISYVQINGSQIFMIFIWLYLHRSQFIIQ